jgi:superfamily II DNA or RNA helicase
MSDDPTRKDKKDFLISDSFGGVIVTVSRRELEARGDVVPVTVCLVPTTFEAPWYLEQLEALRDDGAELGTKRKAPDFGRLLEEMGDDVARTALAVGLARSAVARDSQVLMLAHRRELCFKVQSEFAARGVDCGVLVGGDEWASHFEQYVTEMRAGALRVSIGTYQAVGQALDIKSVSVGVAITPIHTNRQNFQQVRGRFARRAAGKVGGILYVLWDRAIYGDAPVHNFMRWNDGNVQVVLDGETVSGRDYVKGRRSDEQANEDSDR